MERARFTIFFLFSISLLSVLKAEFEPSITNMYVVVVQKPVGMDLETFSLKILTDALGSLEAARKALIYDYKTTYGFAAWLTEFEEIRVLRQPGVLLIMIYKGPQNAGLP